MPRWRNDRLRAWSRFPLPLSAVTAGRDASVPARHAWYAPLLYGPAGGFWRPSVGAPAPGLRASRDRILIQRHPEEPAKSNESNVAEKFKDRCAVQSQIVPTWAARPSAAIWECSGRTANDAAVGGRSARIATGGFMSEADTATRLERMPGKSKHLEQPLEFVRSGLALGGPRFTSRHLPSSTVCSRFTHQIETAQSFAKHGVTDIAASIQDDGACPFICGIRLHW
jgi:hypothetical protein